MLPANRSAKAIGFDDVLTVILKPALYWLAPERAKQSWRLGSPSAGALRL